MIVMLTVLAIWGGFVAAMYVLLWIDTVYYRNNLRQKFMELMNSFTEED